MSRLRNLFRHISRNRAASSALVGAAFFALIFQNCGTYVPTNEQQLVSEQPIKTGCDGATDPSCFGSGSGLQIRINQANPFILTTQETAFDVGGDCEGDGSGNATAITWRLFTLTGAAVGDGSDSGGCDELGRWRARVPIPSPGTAGNYNLVVVLVGIEPSGQTYINSADTGTGNGFGQKSLTVYVQ